MNEEDRIPPSYREMVLRDLKRKVVTSEDQEDSNESDEVS